MGTYRVAQMCPSGHVATAAADQNPERREVFCSRCGEPTLTRCPSCNASIRGRYHVEGVIGLGANYEPPAFCHNCGSAFPWTEHKIASAVELVEVGAELKNFNSSVPT